MLCRFGVKHCLRFQAGWIIEIDAEVIQGKNGTVIGKIIFLFFFGTPCTNRPNFHSCFWPNYPQTGQHLENNSLSNRPVSPTPFFLLFTEAPTLISHAEDGSKLRLRNSGTFSYYAGHKPRTKPPPTWDGLASRPATRLVRSHRVWSL